MIKNSYLHSKLECQCKFTVIFWNANVGLSLFSGENLFSSENTYKNQNFSED
jgi:hypothetical protein